MLFLVMIVFGLNKSQKKQHSFPISGQGGNKSKSRRQATCRSQRSAEVAKPSSREVGNPKSQFVCHAFNEAKAANLEQTAEIHSDSHNAEVVVFPRSKDLNIIPKMCL